MTLAEKVIAALDFSSHSHVDRDERRTAASRLLNGVANNPYRLREAVDVDMDDAYQLIALHDALASILVHQEGKEIIAVGSSFTNNHLSLYIASNGAQHNLYRAKEHLEYVWNTLKEIRQKEDPSLKLAEAGPEFDIQNELRSRIYAHHKAKLKQRLRKWKKLGLDEFFAEAMKEDSVYKGPGKVGTPRLYDEDKYNIQNLNDVYGLVKKLFEVKDKDNHSLDLLSTRISTVNIEFQKEDESQDKKKITNILFDPTTNSFFSRCDAILNILKPDKERKINAFRRYWQKAFSLEHSFKELLRFSDSASKWNHLLDYNFTVATVSAQLVDLKYDLKEDKDFHDFFKNPKERENVISSIQTRANNKLDKGKVNTHCECTLLAHFACSDINTFGYIGVSKLSCLPCWWYFQAYNTHAPAGKHFYTRGTHGKPYPAWVVAKINKELDGAIETDLLSKAMTALKTALDGRKQRSDSDSTDASGASIELRYDANMLASHRAKQELSRTAIKEGTLPDQ